jgi:hypothetical protein
MSREPATDAADTTGVRPSPYAEEQVLEFPSMSYTAVTSNREMAGGFTRYLLAAAGRMVPREWSVQDLSDILTFVLEGGDSPVQFIEGRYLRKRIREQVARADRYAEPFSMLVLRMEEEPGREDVQESLVDVLTERLRRSDMVFLYRHRIAILLPHTPAAVLSRLQERIRRLAEASLGLKEIGFEAASYPGEEFGRPDDVLDWVEDRLR